MRDDGRVAGALGHVDGIERLGERADLIDLDEDGIGDAPGDALGQTLRIGYEKVIADQLAAVDKNILRIAIRECILDNLTPAGAAINEAVELAKAYGSESSARFVNGVLGTLTGSGKDIPQEED